MAERLARREAAIGGVPPETCKQTGQGNTAVGLAEPDRGGSGGPT